MLFRSHLFPPTESGWEPKVKTYSGYFDLGIKDIFDMIDEYEIFVRNNGYFDFKRRQQSKYWMYQTIDEKLKEHFYHNPTIKQLLEEKEQLVLSSNISSFKGAREVLDKYFKELK